MGAGWMLCVRAEDALAAAAAAAAASDKMRSVTLSAPALWLPPAICKHASSGQVLESCSNFALLLLVCACAGAGRSRGRCGGWPAAAGGGRAARRARGAAAARRRAALGLVLSSLAIKVPSLPEASLLPTVPHYCDLSESLRQFLCHSGSSFEDFSLQEFRLSCAFLSPIGQASKAAVAASDKLSARVPCSEAQMTCRFPLCFCPCEVVTYSHACRGWGHLLFLLPPWLYPPIQWRACFLVP